MSQKEKYTLKYNPGNHFVFYAADDSEFLKELKTVDRNAPEDDAQFLKKFAATATAWFGFPLRYSSLKELKRDLFRNGVLEKSNG